jgi:aspartyl-tRNA(Asn)/glutamyl-tRNA(Gln) amidotransferase subunit B
VSWEVVVGIETHAQLLTKSKIFSAAATAFGAPPNTQASAVDIALPGVLPVLNRAAVEHAIRFGLAVAATINRRSILARKNYFYPDLPKGYQISQYEQPIVQGGAIRIAAGDGEKAIRLTRAHLEEDAGKLLHEVHGMSGVDFNRAGTPLLEIVSEPELRGAKEAVAYARALHALVVWIGICDGNMQEGSFRCDANVSVRRPGAPLGTRCELKNLNSFRFMERAIEYEARRQIELLEDGGRVEQETRLYDPERDETRSLRTKEEAHDYRYFPDPDLLPLIITEAEIERIGKTLPELPGQRAQRLTREYAVTAYEAALLTQSRAWADFYEALVKQLGGAPKLAASWMLGEFSAALNRAAVDISESPIDEARFAGLLRRIQDHTISGRAAKEVFDAMWDDKLEADAVIEAKGLRQISDATLLEELIDKVLATNAQQLADYRAGKQKAFNSLVGQVMKASGGKANPAQVNEILRRKLER